MSFLEDRIVFSPRNVDLSRSPLAGHLSIETYVLGAFNPGFTRLPNGNLLMMVRVAEALRQPQTNGQICAIRWEGDGTPRGRYVLDRWPLEFADTSDPRSFLLRGYSWPTYALTSLSWLLPVELSQDAREIVEVHYDRAIAPCSSLQCYGVEDARISKVGETYWMTTCSVSPEKQSTTLYSSPNAMDWTFEGVVLDHQNKDMLIFEGKIDEKYWALTRPLGALYFAYPPGADWLPGPSINLASSPDALHWKPHDLPGIRSRAGSISAERIGGGAQPILTDQGWLVLWHGVEPGLGVGTYRTFWSLLDANNPAVTLYSPSEPLIEPNPALTEPLRDLLYLDGVVFSTGIVDAGDHYIVASGEADLACRITHIPKSVFRR